MKGNLQQVPLPEVLQFISMGKSTGFLHLDRYGVRITLSIRSGKIINSTSLDRRRRIGDLLVNRGLLKRSELARLLKVQKTAETDKPLGHLITEREIVSEETIRETLRLQLEEEIWDLFAWEEGDFEFESAEPSKLPDAIVQIDIEPMILEGTRRNDEWNKIQDLIPNDQVIPVATLPSEDFERELELRPMEWEVLAAVNGRFPVRAIVSRSNLGRFEVHMILWQFLQSGLLRLREEGEVESEENGLAPGNEPERAGTRNGKGGSKTLFGSLLNKGGRKEKSETKLEFLSPIGAVAWFTSEMVRRAASQESAKRDRILNLPVEVWAAIVQTYTRSDLITVTKERFNTILLETYLQSCGFSEVTDECYEDAMEGLVTALSEVYESLSGLIGEKTAGRIARDLLEETRSALSLRYKQDFDFGSRVQTVLKAAV